MKATLRMSGVFTDEESSGKLLDLLKTAPGILCITEAFTEALKCMSADKEVKRSILMPLVDIPYEFEEVESAEDRAVPVRLEREKEKLQKLLDAALKAQEEPKAPKRSRAEAEDPGTREGQQAAEESKQAKAEVDKLVDKANKQTIYDRIDTCLAEYGTLVRSFASTMAWFKLGRKAVREILAEQATVAEQKKNAKVARRAEKVGVPETSEDESESESGAEGSEEAPPPGGHVCGFVQGLCL